MSIQVLSAQEFRQKLAGLVDPSRSLPPLELSIVKDEAIKLCLIFAEVFGESLDRKTLWERIGNGMLVCAAKCGGDWELFLDQMLEYIKADAGKVAANKSIDSWIESMECKPKEWKEQFIRACESKRMFIIVKARAIWNSNKRPSPYTEDRASDGFLDESPEA